MSGIQIAPTARTTKDLTAAQRQLVDIMSLNQFGRIENLSVRAGQPAFDQSARLVRVARLAGESDRTSAPNTDYFELRQAVCALFDELMRLQEGVVLRLEFRHGLPFLLETAAAMVHDRPSASTTSEDAGGRNESFSRREPFANRVPAKEVSEAPNAAKPETTGPAQPSRDNP